MNILITGVSSGLGYELAKQFNNEGHCVYGLSRNKSDLDINWHSIDLSDIYSIEAVLKSLLDSIELDLVILNAGQLGEIKPTSDLDIQDFNNIMNVNFLSNKVIIDYVMNNNNVKCVIGMSTGAALKPYYGWSLYCTTKSAFKQLISVYAEENPDIQFISLAPGIIKTPMQDYIKTINPSLIPSVCKFHNIYDDMDSPTIVANNIINNLTTITKQPSGAFVDLRKINI